MAVTVDGLPAFAVNEAVYRDEGGWLAEPDLSLAEAKIAIEYQGEEHADASRMRRDLTRFADLRANGWAVLAYGPAETFTRPWTAPNEVRAVLRVRAPHLLLRRVGDNAASGQVEVPTRGVRTHSAKRWG